MKILSTLILAILLGVLGFLLYQVYLNIPTNPISEEFSGETPKQALSTSSQFYPNMRFKDSKISYKIESLCDDKRKSDVLQAMSILEEKTLLEFYPSSNPEIIILCSELPPEPEIKNHFVAGEGGPTEIVNTTVYSVILAGKISLFRSETCKTPQIALHEMLHVLGFDHNNNPSSILYPTTSCKQELDRYIIEDINRLYQTKSAPDLSIEKVSAVKSGRYLNFNITTANFGLQDANSVVLTVIADNQEVKEFELNKIEVGTKKILTVENIQIPRSATKIIFFADKANKIEEISEENNKVELLLQ